MCDLLERVLGRFRYCLLGSAEKGRGEKIHAAVQGLSEAQLEQLGVVQLVLVVEDEAILASAFSSCLVAVEGRSSRISVIACGPQP